MRSSSKDYLKAWIDPKMFGCMALGAFFLSLVAFFSVGFGDGYFQRQLCLGAGCWEEFQRLYSLPIAVVTNFSKALVAYSAVAGILVAANTYRETRKVGASQIHFASRAAFESYVVGKMTRLRYLDSRIVSIELWYSLMYPGSKQGDLSVSAKYLGHIRELSAFVKRTDAMIFAKGKGFRHDRYQGPVIEKLKYVGIDISGTSRLEFFSLEREAYKIINDVNEIFCDGLTFELLRPSQAHGMP